MPSNIRPCLFLTAVAFLCLCSPKARAEDRFVRWLSPSVRSLDVEIEELLRESEGLPELERSNRSNTLGYHSDRYRSADGVSWVEVDLKSERQIDQIAVLPVYVEMSLYEGQSYGFPIRFKIEVFGENLSHSVVVAEKSSEDYWNTDGYPFLVRFPESVRGRYVRMSSLAPKSKILVLTAFDNSEKIYNAICAGASGYLLKSAGADDIVRAIDEALSGRAPMTPSLAVRVLRQFSDLLSPSKLPDDYKLTER